MKTLNRVLNVCVTVAAVVYVVLGRVLTQAILWWSENGEIVKTRIVQFILLTMDAIGACYYAGKGFRIWVNNTQTKVQDFLYYQSIAIYC